MTESASDFRMKKKDNMRPGFKQVDRFHLDSAHKFSAEKLQSIFDWWQGFSPDVPYYRDFDILNHAKYASDIFLYKVLGEERFEVRINGDKAEDIIGRKYTGKIVDSAAAQTDPIINDLLNYLNNICKLKQPFGCKGTYTDIVGKECYFESVDCPLLGADGEVSYIVGMMDSVSGPVSKF